MTFTRTPMPVTLRGDRPPAAMPMLLRCWRVSCLYACTRPSLAHDARQNPARRHHGPAGATANSTALRPGFLPSKGTFVKKTAQRGGVIDENVGGGGPPDFVLHIRNAPHPALYPAEQTARRSRRWLPVVGFCPSLTTGFIPGHPEKGMSR